MKNPCNGPGWQFCHQFAKVLTKEVSHNYLHRHRCLKYILYDTLLEHLAILGQGTIVQMIARGFLADIVWYPVLSVLRVVKLGQGGRWCDTE